MTCRDWVWYFFFLPLYFGVKVLRLVDTQKLKKNVFYFDNCFYTTTLYTPLLITRTQRLHTLPAFHLSFAIRIFSLHFISNEIHLYGGWNMRIDGKEEKKLRWQCFDFLKFNKLEQSFFLLLLLSYSVTS